MSVPLPSVSLSEGCSTIYNNTLYAYSPNAFQSLSLTKGANWTELPMGISVTGAACVQATPPDASTPAAFYIVGGTANSTQPTYQGFQRYKFAENTWETLTPSTAVTQNRLYHDAVYINSSASIFVYAGTQDGTMHISSQTFTISTSFPYRVLAYESSAPPSISPLLLPWSNSQAIMLGGSSTNTKVMIFNPDTAWTDSGITVAQPLKNNTAVKAVVVEGDDTSKSLYTFDMSVSPNQVNRTVLVDATGNPVTSATPILSRSLVGESIYETELVQSPNVKRSNLTLAAWPTYNATYAPTDTRSGYSIANDAQGRVIISGGNDADPLCIFNARDNSWTNASSLFTNADVKVQSVSSSTTLVTSTSSTPTASSSSSSSSSMTSSTAAAAASQSTAASSSGGGLSASTTTILAAVLSSVVGVAFLLALGLCFLRWHRKRRQFLDAGHQRRASGIPPDEKDPLDFAGPGIALQTPADRFRGHGHKESQGSFSSMAILMGKVGDTQSRGVLGRRNGSNGSDSSSTFNKKYKNAISNPIPQGQSIPLDIKTRDEKAEVPGPSSRTAAPTARVRASGAGPRGSTRRSSGWNRYWSGGSTLNILGFGGKRATYESGSDRSSNSQYSDSGQRARTTQDSAMVPPLNLVRPHGRMSRVASGSPTIAHASSGFPLKEGMAGQIERPHSSSSSVSSYDDDHRDAFSSGVPASINDEPAWNAVKGHDWSTGRRAPSSIYTEDNYPNLPRNMSITDPSRAAPHGRQAPSNGQSPAPHISDMSWLNLGGSSRI